YTADRLTQAMTNRLRPSRLSPFSSPNYPREVRKAGPWAATAMTRWPASAPPARPAPAGVGGMRPAEARPLASTPWLAGTLAPLLFLLPLLAAGCNGSGLQASLHPASLEAPAASIRTPQARSVALAGAGGEWLDFVAVHEGSAASLRLAPLQRATDSPLGRPPRMEARIYRVADLPVNTNRAGYLRLYGGRGGVTTLPRALVPLAGDGRTFRLSGAGPSRLWIDLRLPRGLERGRWRTALEALSPEGEVLARLPIEILAHGFDLPEQRSLIVSGTLDWERLAALWPDAFSSLSPTLLSRTDI